MNSKITTLIVTIFLVCFNSLSSMDPHTTAKTIVHRSHQDYLRWLADLPNLEASFRADITNNEEGQIYDILRQHEMGKQYIITRQKQREADAAKIEAERWRTLSTNLEAAYHLNVHGIPEIATKEHSRILAYHDQIQELPKPSGQPVDPRTTVDPTLTADLRKLVAEYLMYRHHYMDTNFLESEAEKESSKVTAAFRTFNTYAHIRKLVKELPANIRPNNYDEPRTIAWLQDFLKADAQRRRLEKNQELQRKLQEALTTTIRSQDTVCSYYRFS